MSTYQLLSPSSVARLLESGEELFIVDVREPRQFHAGHLPEAVLLPADTFAERYTKELSPDDPVLLVCERGRTATAAAEFLTGQGFTQVMVLEGGMTAWREAQNRHPNDGGLVTGP